ncbi:hypothetical protein C2S52_017561 [Perilla frutescens var. hirtella]|nr:hypothetical protein C2S52_017561 [Perilla frutescens var. hirtella]
MDSDKDNPVPENPSQENEQQPAPAAADDQEEDPPPEIVAKSSPLPPDLAHISNQIDQYISSLLESKGGDVPIIIEQFLVLVEEKMDDYDSGDNHVKWSRLKEEDAAWFLEAVDRISSLSKGFSKFSSEYKYAYSINRVGCVLQRAMSYLEEEFKLLLEEYKQQQQFVVSAASPSNQESGAGTDGSSNSVCGYSDETTSDLIRLSKAMIVGGYEAECCQVYFIVRREALEEYIVQLGLDKHSIDDVHKKPWESLEREIELWILRFTNFAKSQFSSERKLSDSVFAGNASISERLFRSLSCSITKHVLKFAEAVSLTRRSPDKLFKYLTMYETVREVIYGIGSLLASGVAVELKNEAWMIRSHLGEAMISILTELENSIKNDHGKNPVPGGAVHPLTTYIMNYLEYTAIYKKTLEQVYLEHQRMEDAAASAASNTEATEEEQHTAASSPFQAQILRIMDLLDSNIEAKSKFYKDTSLTSIFMMNNGRYMLKKIKKSEELRSLLGEAWYRKMSSDLRQYHKGYQRETWGKLLGYLNPEGLTGNNKHVKPMLKDRFKNFNSLFDEIRKTQTNWVISDEQLQSELRVSISNMVVPAYRSFLARYSQIFSAGRQTEKYIKHQPDDVETAIDGLFSGTPGSSGKRKL